MRDAPDTRDLIATARETLKAEILPQLSGRAKYSAAMIANALGIALRDLDTDMAAEAAAERDALRRLLGSDEADLAALNAAFAAAIRAGRFDPGSEGHEAARAALVSQTRARLASVAPKALGAGSGRAG